MVPGDIRSVSVGDFDNQSRQEGLEKTLAFAFEREFYERGTLPLREDPSEGDGIITGTIREFRIRPVVVRFRRRGAAVRSGADARRHAAATGRRRGALEGLAPARATRSTASARDAVVPSSSQFQQGTLDFANLAELSDIQLAETEKRLAIERMVRAIVRDVHDRILDDF